MNLSLYSTSESTNNYNQSKWDLTAISVLSTTQNSLDKYFHENIFEPLNMNHTIFIINVINKCYKRR